MIFGHTPGEPGHEKENEKCPACWAPYPIECSCGGYIHGEASLLYPGTPGVGEEKICDVCGDYFTNDPGYEEINVDCCRIILALIPPASITVGNLYSVMHAATMWLGEAPVNLWREPLANLRPVFCKSDEYGNGDIQEAVRANTGTEAAWCFIFDVLAPVALGDFQQVNIDFGAAVTVEETMPMVVVKMGPLEPGEEVPR